MVPRTEDDAGPRDIKSPRVSLTNVLLGLTWMPLGPIVFATQNTSLLA
jgi:hypothetical protein